MFLLLLLFLFLSSYLNTQKLSKPFTEPYSETINLNDSIELHYNVPVLRRAKLAYTSSTGSSRTWILQYLRQFFVNSGLPINSHGDNNYFVHCEDSSSFPSARRIVFRSWLFITEMRRSSGSLTIGAACSQMRMPASTTWPAKPINTLFTWGSVKRSTQDVACIVSMVELQRSCAFTAIWTR